MTIVTFFDWFLFAMMISAFSTATVYFALVANSLNRIALLQMIRGIAWSALGIMLVHAQTLVRAGAELFLVAVIIVVFATEIVHQVCSLRRKKEKASERDGSGD